MEVRKRFRRKRPALFKSSQWHFHQNNAPVSNSIQTVPHPPYSADIAPCVFWLFPKLRGCRYEISDEMKETVTKVFDTLTQDNFQGPNKSCWNGTTSALQPQEITSKGTRVSCVYYQ